MALATVAALQQAQAAQLNQYRDLLTGVMVDQPVTIGNDFIATGRLKAGAGAFTQGQAGDVVARRSATTGAYYFGDNSSVYLYWDGSNFNLSGGPLLIGTAQVNLAGEVKYYAGSTAPAGWSLCDGSAVSRTTYAALFAAIGTTYGVGDGTTTFNLPDCRGRVLVGAGAGSGLTSRALNAQGGEETHVLTTAELPDHRHEIRGATTAGISNTDDGYVRGTTVDANFRTGGVRNVTGTGGSNGYGSSTPSSGTAHNNMQPFIALNVIIKL